MGIPDKMKSIVSSQKNSVRQRTFTFDINEVERANEALGEFCDSHNVVGIMFDRVDKTLLYRCVYK